MNTTILTIGIFVLMALLAVTIYLIYQEKKKVAKLEKDKESLTNQVLVAKDRKKEVESILHQFAKYMTDIRIEATTGKSQKENQFSLEGMRRSDHGELLRVIQENPHSGAAALNLWLPYGKDLRTLEIVQSTQNIWIKHKKEMK